jgi:hypothetical protein
MTKNLLFCLLAVLLLTTCKKDAKTNTGATLDVTGTWTLYSWKSNLGSPLDVTANEYPCIADNVLTLNANGTTKLIYTGSDSCYVTAIHHGSGVTTIGIPGQAAVTSTWRQDGNNVYLPDNSGNPGVVTNVNGKLYMTTTVTETGGGVITTVDVKQ